MSAPTLLKNTLNRYGFRVTAQRQKILDIFQALPQGEHLSADEVHQRLRQQRARISLSTVYRTLHVLVHLGILRELELAEGHKHYEVNHPDTHHHLVCVQCNHTLEFMDDRIQQVSRRQAEAAGYNLLDCQFTLYVICPEAIAAETQGGLPRNWVCPHAHPRSLALDEADGSRPVAVDLPDSLRPASAEEPQD